MKLRTTGSLAIVLSTLLAGCESVSSGVNGVSDFLESSFTNGSKDGGLTKVEDLLDRIERVHVETELSQDSVHLAMESLAMLVSPDFGGEPMTAYTEFSASIEACEKQAEKLRDMFRANFEDKGFGDLGIEAVL